MTHDLILRASQLNLRRGASKPPQPASFRWHFFRQPNPSWVGPLRTAERDRREADSTSRRKAAWLGGTHVGYRLQLSVPQH